MEVLTLSSSWLLRRSQNNASFRLFCFPYAAGNPASFLAWQDILGPTVEVCAVHFPGRGRRLREPNIDRLEPLINKLAQVISEEQDLPFGFFGHSLGALVAFELARFCKLSNVRRPQQLIVSGCEAPSTRADDETLHLLGDQELISELRDYNGTPAEVLEHREYMSLVLPSIRADFAIAETYSYLPKQRLDEVIHVFAGADDTVVSPANVHQWLNETHNPGNVHWFDGGHFFLDTLHEEIAWQIRDLLQSDGLIAR